MKKLTPISAESATDGIWTSYFGAKIRIARMNSPAFSNYFNQLLRPHRRQSQQGTLSEEVQKEILCEALAKHVITDWEWTPKGGDNIPFTHDNAVELMKIDVDFQDFVVEFASNLSNYVEEEVEELAGKF